MIADCTAFRSAVECDCSLQVLNQKSEIRNPKSEIEVDHA
jgi:hypothetical protein